MFGTYKNEDVTILLKDITGLVEPLSTVEREKQIQSGRHYCEMLPIEYKPSKQYLDTFYKSLRSFGRITASSVKILAQKIYHIKELHRVLAYATPLWYNRINRNLISSLLGIT